MSRYLFDVNRYVEPFAFVSRSLSRSLPTSVSLHPLGYMSSHDILLDLDQNLTRNTKEHPSPCMAPSLAHTHKYTHTHTHSVAPSPPASIMGADAAVRHADQRNPGIAGLPRVFGVGEVGGVCGMMPGRTPWFVTGLLIEYVLMVSSHKPLPLFEVSFQGPEAHMFGPRLTWAKSWHCLSRDTICQAVKSEEMFLDVSSINTMASHFKMSRLTSLLSWSAKSETFKFSVISL